MAGIRLNEFRGDLGDKDDDDYGRCHNKMIH